ncbi:hypothetical protein CN425_12945 [Bacillus cereus]|uniref:Uncharacterized protein n=1 Tax=Bacillus cereus TaxID=1396 RepID=A0A2A8PWU8_BACCE|nr:hypothetical protein [Bacillus cereus]PEW01515.1 hypothetical protein CN425_12945 [Bacillus cereus]
MLILTPLKSCLKLEWLAATLCGLLCSSALAVYNAVSPLLNKKVPFTFTEYWSVSKFQCLGFITLVLLLILLLLTPNLKKNYKSIKNKFFNSKQTSKEK